LNEARRQVIAAVSCGHPVFPLSSTQADGIAHGSKDNDLSLSGHEGFEPGIRVEGAEAML
jgi:hypothetical protein